MPRLLRALVSSWVVVMISAVIGCASSTPGSASASADTDVASAQTRVITDVEGTEVTVPAHPQRVVTLSEPMLDGALALGVTPVGTVSGRGQSTVPNYPADRAEGIPPLGGIAQPNYEKIAAAKPDLILVDGTSINNNPDAMEILREIAPTVYTGYAGGDWRTNIGYVADALNQADAAQALMGDYDQRTAELADQLSVHADKTFSIVRWQGGSASLILKELPPGQALTDLGLKRPEGQDRDGRGHSEPVSLENMADIDPLGERPVGVFGQSLGGALALLSHEVLGARLGYALSQSGSVWLPGLADAVRRLTRAAPPGEGDIRVVEC